MEGGGGRGRGGWRGGGRGWRGGGGGRGGRWGRGAAPEPPSSAGSPLSVAFEAEAAFMASLADCACPFEMQAAEVADGATRATLYTPAWNEAQLLALIDWFDAGCNSLGVASLHFPAEWLKEDRARAHRAAEARGLPSRSSGVGPQRRLSILSPAAADKEDDARAAERTAAPAVDEDEVFALLRAAREAGTQLSRGEAADMLAAQAVPPALQAAMEARMAAAARTTALVVAAARGDADAVTSLLDEVASSAADSAAAVRRACAARCDAVGGAAGVRRGDTALHAAARAGSLPVIAALLSRGADVDAVDGRGAPALAAARAAEQCDAEAALLRAGAVDPDTLDRFAAPQPHLGGGRGRGGGRGWGRGQGRGGDHARRDAWQPPAPKADATAVHAGCWRGAHVAAAALAGLAAGVVLGAAVMRRR